MTTQTILLFAALLGLIQGGTQEALRLVRVPEGAGSSVRVGGVFGPDEWADALNVSEGAPFDVYVKRDRHDVFIGIRCSSHELPVLDLFLDPSGPDAVHLHVSSYLADGFIPESDPPESELSTELAVGWTANRVTWDSEKRDSLLAAGVAGQEMLRRAVRPFDGFELKIGRSQFENPRWFVMIQVRAFAGSGPPRVFPLGADPEEVETWLSLDVNSRTGSRPHGPG